MKKLIIIPSRAQSTRLPNKPLKEFGGKTLVQHVWEKAIAVPSADVYVATDSDEIANKVKEFGGEVLMTASELPTGTDRVLAATTMVTVSNYDCVINLQGDMPFIEPTQILASTLPLDRGYDVGTLVYDMHEAEQNNPNSVKAIVSMHSNNTGKCHWFVRAPLKYGYHHAGIYSYSLSAVEKIKLFAQSTYENVEKLEQLRFLENGLSIGAQLTNHIDGEINTPSDLDQAQRRFGF